MSLFMSGKVRTLSESLEALRVGADIRLFSRMCSQMGAKVEVKRESLFANLALVRSFTGVY
jgi:hypothetical protein